MEENRIKNLKEKMLLVARRIIVRKIDPTDENITVAWCALCYADKHNLNINLIEQIRRYINSNDLKSCDKSLNKLRSKGKRNLKTKGKYVGYGAALVKQPKNVLATYNIFTKGKKFSGNYCNLLRRLETFSKIEN